MGNSLFFYSLLAIGLVNFTGCSKEDLIIDSENDTSSTTPTNNQNQDDDHSVCTTNYYVATNGSDNNPGTYSQPWATWQKAFKSAKAGDTIFFRGGTYYPTESNYGGSVTISGLKGTSSKNICFYNYPGETPILDCSKSPATAGTIVGLDISNSTYLHFKGLTIQNRKQTSAAEWVAGINANGNGTLKFEQCTSTGHGGSGFFIINYDTLYLINCDSYDNCDALGADPGGRGDGFHVGLLTGEQSDFYKYTYVYGCRSWNNSDDGIDVGSTKQFEFSNNWSWSNGKLEMGEGNGFKFAYSDILDPKARQIHNNLAAFNKRGGFIEVNLLSYSSGPFAEYYNNSVYKCESGFESCPGNYNSKEDPAIVIYRNNLVYNSTNAMFDQTWLYACSYGYPVYATQDHNTWSPLSSAPYWQKNPAYKVTDEDFVSLDPKELSKSRNSDGSLPNVNFLHLAKGSDLIDGGTPVGLHFNGSNPDLGAFESE